MQRYSEYKDSGVKWLGEIPSHWEVQRLGKLCKFSKGLQFTKADLTDSGVPVVSYGQVHAKYNSRTHLSRELIRYIPNSFLPKNTKSKVVIGDFIVADTSEDIEGCGNMAFNDCQDELYGGYHTILIQQLQIYSKKYLAYLFNSIQWRSQIRSQVNGVKVYTVNRDILKQSYIFIPSNEEQLIIVDYLDKVTSKIDAAIAQQQRMIELLNERKQIIINDAVTKGLDPNVKMKDSEVEWIGEIPEHWEMKRLKTILSIKDEKNSDPSATLLSVYTAIGVKPRKELKERGNKANTVINYKIVNKGDLIVNRLLAWMGACGLSNYDGVTSPDYDVYAFRSGYNRLYYELYFRNTHFKSDCYKYGHGIMMMRWRTYPDEFLNIMIPVPPLEEQTAIYNHINPLINNIAAYIEKCNNQITLLQERKQIIINDVVTGKVKVI